jgi:hypothetical protein
MAVNGRTAAVVLGCAGILIGSAGIASKHIWPRPADSRAPVSLFAISAQKMEPSAWPPSNADVAFNAQMIELLTIGANAARRAYAYGQQQQQQARQEEWQEPPSLPMSRREAREERRRLQREERARQREEQAREYGERREGWARQRDERRQARRDGRDGEAVEILIRDRHGRVVRTQRVSREAYEARGQSPDRVREQEPRAAQQQESRAEPRQQQTREGERRQSEERGPTQERSQPPLFRMFGGW